MVFDRFCIEIGNMDLVPALHSPDPADSGGWSFHTAASIRHLLILSGNPHCRSHNPRNNIHPQIYQLSYPRLPATVYRLPDKACLLLRPAALPGNSGNRSYQAWKIPSHGLPSRSSYSQVAGSSYSDKDNFHWLLPTSGPQWTFIHRIRGKHILHRKHG